MFSSSLHLLNLFLQEQKTQFRLDDACLFLGQQAPEHIESRWIYQHPKIVNSDERGHFQWIAVA